MAIIDSGLGWSADEDYMAQYAGVVLATISGLSGGVRIPYVANDADVPTQGLYVGTDSDGRSVYLRADDDTYDYILLGVSETGGNRGLWIVSTANGSVTRFQYNADHSLRAKTALTGFSSISGTGLWRHTAGYSNWDTYFTDVNPNIPVYTTYADAVAACVITHASITKAQDGYCVLAYVRYKWEGGYGDIDETPVLISTLDAATEITGHPSGVPSVSQHIYYQGAIFRMTFLCSLEGATRGNILLLDYTSAGELNDNQLFERMAQSTSLTVEETIDPYDPSGAHASQEEGGGGTDPTDDEVPLEPVVFPSAVNTGFCRIYCPSASELSALSDYLWSPLFDLDTVKRLFSDPMNSVLGLSVVPVSVTGVSTSVSIAGVDTGISLPKLSAQHINVDLGSLQVVEKWGAYLDYEPYTKYSIYLPFIGYRTISSDDIMGKWVHLSYDIDLLSGACVAKLVSGSTLLYQWAGSCAMQLPVNAENWNSVISSSLVAIGSTATAIASGGAAAPVVAGVLASAGTLATQMKPNIERAGGLSGAAAFLAGRRAYMIRTMPELINPGDQPHYIGYPSFVTKQLGTLTGYNVVEDIHLEGIPATQAELEEIDTLLHEGVIL